MFKNQKAPINNDNISQTTLEGARPISYGMKSRSSKTLAVVWVTLLSFLAAPASAVFVAFAQNVSDGSMTEIFPRNLRVGDRGQDVQTLQKVLNQSLETKLTENGPGAPGEETTYFGELTKSAIVRFQEKYAQEILFPIQLVQGTGFVGPMTRKKLNEAAVEAGITANTQGTSNSGTSSGGTTGTVGLSQGSSSQTTVIKPKIFSISPEKVPNGGEITITGEGFTNDNTIRTAIGSYDHIASLDTKTLKLRLYSESINLLTNPPNMPTGEVFDFTPEEAMADIPVGTQDVSILASTTTTQFSIPVVVMVENKNGMSNQMVVELHTSNFVAKNESKNIFAKLTHTVNTFFNPLAISLIPTAYAKRKFDWFAWAQGTANGMWSSYTSQGANLGSGGGSPAAYPNFGGRVVMTFTCTCPVPGISYFIYPVGGIPGPYGVTMIEYPLVVKQNYAIFPGNNVLGKSYGVSTGTCGIGILAWCFQFPVARTQVVGTSLTSS